MVDSWFEAAARWCLCCFQFVAAGLVVATAVRCASGRRPPARVSRIARLCFEYVGNVEVDEAAERRVNLQGRELVDWVKRQIARRRLPVGQEQRILQSLRDILREDGALTPNDRPWSRMED